MSTFMIFGFGVVLGVFAGWRGGRRFESAASASLVAGGYLSIARERWRAAAGAVLLSVVVLAVGGLIAFVSR